MAELRHITIPADVALTIEKTSWSFVRAFVYVIDNHPTFNSTGSGVRAAARIIAHVVDAKSNQELKKAGDVITLDHADWQMVNAAFETPAAGYVPRGLQDEKGRPADPPARMFVPYIEAVSDEATKKLPDSHAVTNGVALPLPPPAAA